MLAAPVVGISAAAPPAHSRPLTLDDLWRLVQSTRGFESSPSPFKKDQRDRLRRTAATIEWDPRGRGAPLGDPVETFAALQLIDKDGRRLATGADFFDKGALRGTEADKLDKHAEARVLRALEKAVPGEVPGGTLSGLVDQEVCPVCREKLAQFAERKKLRMAVVHVAERPKLRSRPGMASPKQTARTSLQALHDEHGQAIKTTFRESYSQVFGAPAAAQPAMRAPTLKSRAGAIGATTGEALVGLLLDLLVGEVRKRIDERTFAERMRELRPSIEQRKLEALNREGVQDRSSPSAARYYIIEIRVTTTTTIYVAGSHSNTIPGAPKAEIQSIRISDRPFNAAGPLHESSKQISRLHPVLLLESSQVLTYSEPVIAAD